MHNCSGEDREKKKTEDREVEEKVKEAEEGRRGRK
jgi:hypothetical protein